jgi:hypothetical protein
VQDKQCFYISNKIGHICPAVELCCTSVLVIISTHACRKTSLLHSLRAVGSARVSCKSTGDGRTPVIVPSASRALQLLQWLAVHVFPAGERGVLHVPCVDVLFNLCYINCLRPVVTYGCEAWTLTNRDEQHLGILECRILRKIFGPVQNEDGSWRIRMNYELNELIRSAGIVRFIKSKNGLARSRDADGC